MANTSKLSPKQKAFCEEYLVDLNATAAYQRVYSCTEASARRNASRLLTNADVAAYIQELQAQRSQRTEITADRVLQEIAAIAFAKLTDAVSFDRRGVTFKDSKELEESTKAALASVTYSESAQGGIRQSLKMHDKISALTLLCKHLGIAEGKEPDDPDPTTGVQWVRLVDSESTDATDQS